jgi:hypothetical protein
MNRIKEYERLVRRLRRDPRLWDDDDRVHSILGRALARLASLRRSEPHDRKRGPYSGLTRSELAKSGTCEPDWF